MAEQSKTERLRERIAEELAKRNGYGDYQAVAKYYLNSATPFLQACKEEGLKFVPNVIKGHVCLAEFDCAYQGVKISTQIEEIEI